MKSLSTLLLRLWVSASLVSVVAAFSASTLAKQNGVIEELMSTPLSRASDGQAVTLPSLWRANTPFGIADETAVCAFLRHYGWFICWEHASQLRDKILPGNNNVKLFFVGIGSADAAKEFATQLDIDPTMCFGDEGGAMGDTLGLEKGIKTMWNPSAVNQMTSRNDKEALEDLGNAYKSALDNVGFKNLAPKDTKDTLRQGGTFIFRGSKPILEHFDSKVGDNADIDAILAAIKK